MHRLPFGLLLLLAASSTPAPGQAPPSAEALLDPFLSAVMALEPVPGLAIAVVQGDSVVYLRGFGFADLEQGRPFTPQTVAYIASATKSFTGLTAALLAHQGRFDLAAPMSRYLPGVVLGEGLDPGAVTMRDLLTHTHGIADGGPIVMRTAFTGDYTPDQLIDLLRFYGPAEQGRAFRYGNLGYNVASLAMDAATGTSWKDLEQQLIFEPLGMASTTAYRSLADSARLAMPYRPTADGGFARLPFAKTDQNMHAAGGLLSTVEDLARWLEVNINLGLLDGRRVFPAAVMRETQALLVTQDTRNGAIQRIGYGLGWNIGVYGGETVILHNGGFPGHRADVSFMPRRRIGVAILTNDGVIGGRLAELLTRFVYDRLRNVPGVEESYAAALADLPRLLADARAAMQADQARRAGRSQVLPHARSAYTGTFENPLMGRLEFALVEDRFVLRAGVLETEAVEVFDAGANQLRVELTGNGEVVTFDFEGERASRLRYAGLTFERVDVDP